jgi:mannose-6-phosphate isomerase
MGAHPLGPSRLKASGATLLDHIAQDPTRALGAEVSRRFAGRLPFLFKVIAAAEPLSLQAHPSAEQAREGFAREEAAGVPLTARSRNYKDDSHKPELVCALTPFVALCGFRAAKESLALLSALELEGLEGPLAELRKAPDARGLRRFFELLYGLPEAERQRLVQSALRGAERLGGKAVPPLSAEQLGLSLDWLPRLAALHPKDAGVIGALLLNVIELQPGEAIFLPAGNLHAYLQGTALELMASSDNVLRGGLTPKHVDVPELLGILSFEPHLPEVLRGDPAVGADRQELTFETPTAEFCFSEVRLGGAHSREWQGGGGPEILLCLEGPVRLSRGGHELELRPGQSVFCDAAGAPYSALGSGRLARARVGRG